MSGGGGGGQTSSTVTQGDPALAPYKADYLNRVGALAQNPLPTRQLATMSPYQQMGLQMTANRALSGSPEINAAKQNLAATQSGAFMSPDSNPYLAGTVNQAMNDAQTRVNSQFAGNGYGSTAHQEILGRTLGETAGNLYNQNYQNERQRQIQGMLFAPQLAQTDYMDAQNLLGVGDTYRGYSQEWLDQQYQQAMEPWTRSDLYGNSIARAAGVSPASSSETTGTASSNRMAGAIGGGALGYGLSTMVPALGGAGIPLAIGGALLGGLL